MLTSDLKENVTKKKLIDSVLSLSGRCDIDTLTSRHIAKVAGVSTSAVNYSFGSIDQLVETAGVAADATLADRWSEWSSKLDEFDYSRYELAPIIFSVARSTAINCRGQEGLFWKSVIGAARLGQTEMRFRALNAEQAYWEMLSRKLGLDELAPRLLQSFCLALRFAFHIVETADRIDPWLLTTTNRFVDRLIGAPITDSYDSAVRLRIEHESLRIARSEIPDHDTARRIIQTVIDIMLVQGPSAATFRAIAQKSGLSVSSIQHFFGSQSAYVQAAVQTIFYRVRDRVVPLIPEAESLTLDSLAEHLSGGFAQDQAQSLKDYAATQGLILSSSRTKGSETIAEGLLVSSGRTSFSLLNALKTKRSAISRLDGQILSWTFSHFMTMALAGVLSDWYDDAGRRSLTNRSLRLLLE